MEETRIEELAEDIQMEIMSWLPLKSLVKCTCVSKQCASLIRSKYFRDRYLRRSMTRPRLLFVNFPFGRDVLLHSVYQEEEPLLSSGQQQIRISPDPRCEVSQPIRGLLCIQENTKIVILNPGTKKLLTTKLPKIQAHKNAVITCFFGYDESTDEFKVLCMTKLASDGPSEGAINEHQISTVCFGDETCWRRITCKHDHSPVTQGLCKEGLLYYGAQSSSNKSLVMRFNVSSEVFSVIEVPEEVQLDHRWKLVNYNGDIALVNDSDFDYGIVNGVFDIWVRNETAGDWRRNKIEIAGWEETVDNHKFYFKGTIGTRELVFTLDSVIEGSFLVVYYDTATHNLRTFTIEGVSGDQLNDVRTFLDHVDSTWLM
ncbi:hypothetical protein CARUB_v10021443mg [Capsella rubella]|uniref:F-box domain-containing protein n=1 Tax=Capsella rubella TaxID=81985 RepID=R0HVU5_9BRAS|nr:putative F-box protein At1g70970 [Capsella rubella]EOA33949.1 hypothetical protein CARUB_v10021443mg [Capsella rubella]